MIRQNILIITRTKEVSVGVAIYSDEFRAAAADE